jgi:GNAT superfamily N-acetyltransferase
MHRKFAIPNVPFKQFLKHKFLFFRMNSTAAGWELVLADAADLIESTRIASYSEWGRPQLTLEQYLDRESRLASTDFALQSLQTWVLRHTNGRIAGHCDTYNRPCWLQEGSHRRELDCISVAIVFICPEFRGLGLGTLMMRLLRERLSQLGAVVSNLYSDVGRRFYSRPELGWMPFSTAQMVADVERVALDCIIDTTKVIGDGQQDHELLKRLIAVDQRRLQSEMDDLARNSNGCCAAFTILPTFEAYEWFYQRSLVYKQSLKQSPEINNELPRGCWISDEQWMVYFYDYTKFNLHILRYSCSDDLAGAKSLLRQAGEDARRFGFKTVTIWQPDQILIDCRMEDASTISVAENVQQELGCSAECSPPQPVSLSRGCTLSWRSDEIPCLTVFNSRSSSLQTDDIKWLANQKYAWV